jgi:hypothetical protein
MEHEHTKEGGMWREAFEALLEKELAGHASEDIIDTLRKRLYRSSKSEFADILKNIKKTLDVYLEPEPKQTELFPVLSLSKSVELKKEFALNFGSIPKLKEKYKIILNNKLPGSNKTLLQLFNEVEDWYKNLRGEDLGNWLKLFAFAKAVKEQAVNEPDTIGLFEDRKGVYRFLISADQKFYEFFAKPDGARKDGRTYHTTRLKDKIIAWFDKNKDAVEFPVVVALPNQTTAVFPHAKKIYTFEKGLREDGKPVLVFSIDTNILESEFKDYVSISIAEIDAIAELWEETLKKENDASEDPLNLKTLSLNGFVDVPLKFLLTLKEIYSREGDYTNKEGTFNGNVQTLSKENLDLHLGSLLERVQKHLESRNVIRTGKTSDMPAKVMTLILEAVFATAVHRRWLLSKPGYVKGIYKFNINAGYFDKRETAKRLRGPAED